MSRVVHQREIDASAVALFKAMADEFDCWDEDPLEDGRRWRPLAETALIAAAKVAPDG